MIATAAIIVIIQLLTGCHYFQDHLGDEKRLPAPLARNLPVEVQGSLYRVWRANEVQIKFGMHTAYLILQGVNNPDREESVEQEAIRFVEDLISGKTVTATVYEYDSFKRSVAQVFVGDIHLNLEIIRQGWGQYDGTPFENGAAFDATEQEARKKKRGMWNKQP